MCVLLPCPLSSPELRVQNRDRNKCAQGGGFTGFKASQWKPLHRGSRDRVRRKAEASLKRCWEAGKLWGNTLVASNAEVWKYEAIKTNGNCETRACWTARRCLRQINKPRAWLQRQIFTGAASAPRAGAFLQPAIALRWAQEMLCGRRMPSC